MSLDPSSTAAAVVGIQQAKYNMQLGVAALKQQANAQQNVANAIISAIDSSIYTATGRSIAPSGQLLNGRG